ncbi:MAG TPA: hypothetical protein VG318_01870 [Actinomycetota bacterium]|nr:hypothetical protein [Actinomycetota bacterium]
MTSARTVDASLRAGFYEELLVRLARTASRRAAFRRIAPGAALTLTCAAVFSVRRRGR